MDIDNNLHDIFLPELIARLRLCLESEIRQKGFRRFTYFIARKANFRNPFIMSNHPTQWTEEYKRRSLHLSDPVIQFGLSSAAPFSWADLGIKSDTHFSFLEKTRRYPLTNGHCFTLHDANGYFSLLSVCDRANPALNPILEQQNAEIQMLLIRVHQLMVANTQLLEFVLSESSTKPLTQREHEILNWASIGKTYAEISLITSISVRTVKFHMRNIVDKLDVTNAKHAISKAQQDGLCLQLR